MTCTSLLHRPQLILRHFAVFAAMLICLFSTPDVFASNILERADSAYNAEDYKTALSLYNSVLEKQGASSQLYYNIGNAQYRLGNMGNAVLMYERALRLDPSNKNARVNLNFVNSRIKGLPEDGSSFLSNIHSGIVNTASPDKWSVLAIVFFVLTLGCVSLYIFISKPMVRKIGFFGGIVSLIVFIYTFVVAWQTASAMVSHDAGIVMTNNAKLRANPTTTKSSNEKTISIPEGARVEIIDSLSTPNDPSTSLWYNVALSNNNEAWIDASYIEKI